MRTPPSLVALHGFIGSGADFDLLRDRLPTLTWRTPDLPGHGDGETAPHAFRIPAIASAVAHELAALPPPRILLGYSMGGRVALHTALQFPDHVDGLVLIGASPGLADDAERAARIAVDDQRAARALELGGAAFAREWAKVPIIASQATIPPPWRDAMVARRLQSDAAGLALSLELTGTGRMEPLHDRLRDLRMPILLVVGETDSKFRAIAEDMAIRLRRRRVRVIEGAGHAAHLEQPDRFADVLRTWIDESMGDA